MKEREPIRTIVFDYDGTLHDSVPVYKAAFLQAYEWLVEQGLAKKRNWKEQEITKWLGYSSKQMWKEFMPELPDKERETASKMIGSVMGEKIKSGQARLFPGTEQVLCSLKQKGYHMVILSNCGQVYMDNHRKCFSLDEYMEDYYCSGNYNHQPKYEIFYRIKEKYPAGYCIVGDRFHDFEAGTHHGIFTIGCAYGFGTEEERDKADKIIYSVQELLDIL